MTACGGLMTVRSAVSCVRLQNSSSLSPTSANRPGVLDCCAFSARSGADPVLIRLAEDGSAGASPSHNALETIDGSVRMAVGRDRRRSLVQDAGGMPALPGGGRSATPQEPLVLSHDSFATGITDDVLVLAGVAPVIVELGAAAPLIPLDVTPVVRTHGASGDRAALETRVGGILPLLIRIVEKGRKASPLETGRWSKRAELRQRTSYCRHPALQLGIGRPGRARPPRALPAAYRPGPGPEMPSARASPHNRRGRPAHRTACFYPTRSAP